MAVSRVCLGATAFIVELTHPLAPEPRNDLLILMLLVYCVQNLGFVLWILMNPDPSPASVKIMHVSDLFWPIAFCLFADPPSSLVFVFFLFALMTTAFRFGMYETVIAAVGCSLILIVQETVVALGPKGLSQWIYTPLNLSRLVLRCGFLLMAGFLLGYLSEREKELRAEISLTNHLLSLTRVGNRLSEVVTEICAELAQVFAAERAYAVVTQTTSGRLFRWEITLHPHHGNNVRELSAADSEAEMLARYPDTFYIEQRSPGQTLIAAIDDEGRRLSTPEPSEFPMPVTGALSLVAINLELGREWNGRCVLVNGRMGWNRERELRFAQNALRQIAPALYSIYLFRRLRSRAGAMERARVARELHDTAIQSLISIEMQVDVLKRSANGRPQTAELERIQHLLREEVLNLRQLMQSMRPVEVGPNQFLDFIAQLVERFSRDTGVAARFV
ncbi:MAG TPA: histidine kinase dimerization/phosphoacceptor domain-containing protein, partial [Candidatus Angelobacter sp.]|nr:histidine kinase dimerization/phosphoacceptor domain-containing protein [Candidatus Angelobacter sp.]